MENKKLNEEQTRQLQEALMAESADDVKKCLEDSGLVPVFGRMSGAKEAFEMKPRYLKKLREDCYVLVYGFENEFWEGWGSSGIDYHFSSAMILFDWDGNIIDIARGSEPTYNSEIKDCGDHIEARGLWMSLPERLQSPEFKEKQRQREERKRLEGVFDKKKTVRTRYPELALDMINERLKENAAFIEEKGKELLSSTLERHQQAQRLCEVRRQYRTKEMKATIEDRARRMLEQFEISNEPKLENADRNAERGVVCDLKAENKYLQEQKECLENILRNQKMRIENAPQRKNLAQELNALRKEFASNVVRKILPDIEQRLKVRKLRYEAMVQKTNE